MTDDLMTIREMCDAFDVTPRTLRFYEAKELIFPVREGTKRLFTKRDRARLKLILRGKRLGLSLDESAEIILMYGSPGNSRAQLEKLVATIRRKRTELKRQQQDLEAMLRELGDAETNCLAALDELDAGASAVKETGANS